jgi:sterol desaturase/sphingolipid hydroxylase (fatty acid hydroxylase superfamily)
MIMTLKERLYRFRSFWIFPVIAFLLLHFSMRVEAKRSTGELLILFLSGVFAWTLLEYGLHRFVFHLQIPLRNPHLRELVNASHLSHHASPRDPTKVLVRPVYGLVISSILYGLIYAALRNPFSAAVLMTGIWSGFLYYEAVHYRVHFSLSPSGLIARQRRSHFYHHFTNNKRCFGVTSPLWDYVFGTISSE